MIDTASQSRLATAGDFPPPLRLGGPYQGPPFAIPALIAVFVFSCSLFGAPNKPGYVGSDTCSNCHTDISQAFGKNPHHAVETSGKRGWQGMACESCHGPGEKHAESMAPADIINPAKQAPAKTDQTCLKCHLNTPTHAGRIQGGHAKNQVGCTSCHSVHKDPQALKPTRASVINERCAGCHASVWAQFQKPYKHRLPEGAMSCTDCHNPHGSVLPSSIRTVAANEPTCFRCHSDKRGPFVYEHPPVKAEGCQACHEPHGSANPRMLVRHEVRLVCLECHSNIGVQKTIGGVPPAFHDLRSSRFQNCTVCHIKVHGSNVTPSLER